jgi:CubicO group peptidase (beta-lactamase class C family)
MKALTVLAAAAFALSPMPLVSPLMAEGTPAQGEQVRLDKPRIDAALAKMVADGRAAGTSALVWRGGREVYFGHAGYADREAKQPMARDTMVQIYSMTKPITGVALMQLWEQGRFGLDDELARYLSEFANVRVYAGKDANGFAQYRPPVRPILVRDIMRHTAGFSGPGEDNPVYALYREADPTALDIDLAEVGRRLAAVPLHYDPGEHWYYGVAVDVQALLIEKLAGEPYAKYVQEHVLGPLGMKDTAWHQPELNWSRFAAMYLRKGGALVRQDDDTTRALNFHDNKLTPGAFGLASTLDDYMRFARMLLGKGTLGEVRILKPSTVELMATDQLDPRVTEREWLPGKGQVGFGMDFAVRKAHPANAEENRGAVGEFFWDGAATTLFWVDPANDLAAVYFVQTMPFDMSLHRDIRAAVYGPGYRGPAGDSPPD